MRRLLPIAFAAAAFALSCKPNTAVNTDSGEPIPCSSDLDCTTALGAGNCSDGVCVLCTSSSDCPTGETCSANGTCGVGSGNGTGGSTGSGSSGGSSTGGIAGQCTSSCECLADGGASIKGPACISGVCAPLPKLADGGATCARTNDCACGDLCSGGTCQPQCTTNATCPAADPICYLPQGQCGPCTNSTQCPTGKSCVGGKCGGAGDGGVCNTSHCCSDGDCLPSLPSCNPTTGVCGKCTSSIVCSSGYVCNTASGACVAGDGGTGGCGPNGCASGLVCNSAGKCVASSCNPPCGPPATCGANNNCTCPANCGGICATGQTCNTSTCQCGAGTGGTIGGLTGGASGGLIGGLTGGSSGGLPASCSISTCMGCPTGQNCFCINPFASSGLDPCSSSDLACSIGSGIGAGGLCQ